MEGEVLECCKANRYRYNSWKEVKHTIREYNSNDYKPDRTFNNIKEVKQTCMVSKFQNNINRLHVNTKWTDYHLFDIMLTSITSGLCKAIAHSNNLRRSQSNR